MSAQTDVSDTISDLALVEEMVGKQFTLDDQRITVSLPAAVWRLFDVLHGSEPVKRRLAMQQYLRSWRAGYRMRSYLSRQKTHNHNSFSSYLTRALTLAATERLVEKTLTALPEKVDLRVVVPRATVNRLNSGANTTECITVDLEVVESGFDSLDSFALYVRGVECAARQRLGSECIAAGHPLDFDAFITYDATREMYVARGLTLLGSEDVYDHVADLYLHDLKETLTRRYNVVMVNENGNVIAWD